MPVTSADNGFPELAPQNTNIFSGVVTRQNHGLSTHDTPYHNLQLLETIPNRHGEDYDIPTLDVLEGAVWTTMTQPTINVHQNQSFQYTIDQHPLISTQPFPAFQPSGHAPLIQTSQQVLCASCPSIWCFHLESIMFSDPEDKGVSNLKRSYRDLRQHIHEVHQWHYGATCAMCENMFCHLGKMIQLEAAKTDFKSVKIDLGSSFMTLRKHIQEAHSGC